jgi:hypothetical protein
MQEERVGYMTAPVPAIQHLLESGVQIIRWGYNDPSTFVRADYDFFGVWTFLSEESAKSFEQMEVGGSRLVSLF